MKHVLRGVYALWAECGTSQYSQTPHSKTVSIASYRSFCEGEACVAAPTR